MIHRLKAAVVGASGYIGEELVRLILNHPRLLLSAISSRQHAGAPAASVLGHLPLPDQLIFSASDAESLLEQADIFFLALPHGESERFARPLSDAGRLVFDLSADLRIKDRARFAEFYGQEAPDAALIQRAVYGNPETNREAICQAKLIACPGCYPTSVLLALAPALAAQLVRPDSIIIHSMSGVSGAGRKVDASLMFVECNENVRPYGVATHRHVPEIEQELSRLAGQPVTVQFTPHLLPVTRGILTSIVAEPLNALPDGDGLLDLFTAFYRDAPFVKVRRDALPELRSVVHTNRCDVSARIDPRTRRLLFFSSEDNLLKGAAGQAIQCLNIMQGWPECEGLPR